MLDDEIYVLHERVTALEVVDRRETPASLERGTRYKLRMGKFEWLRHDGLYSEIVVPALPGRTFRVRYHQLQHATRRETNPHLKREIA
jgi:hypothetical protein